MLLHAAAALGVPRPARELAEAGGVAGARAPKPCWVSSCPFSLLIPAHV